MNSTSTECMPDWWAQMQAEFTRDQRTAMARQPTAQCECAMCAGMAVQS